MELSGEGERMGTREGGKVDKYGGRAMKCSMVK